MNKPIGARVLAVLFDLDGTLIDSAPDLAGTGNDMRIARGLAPYPLAHFRPMVGSGARGMVGRAFGVAPSDPATFATAIGLTLLTVFAGTLIPAWRAVRLTPMSVLRAE